MKNLYGLVPKRKWLNCVVSGKEHNPQDSVRNHTENKNYCNPEDYIFLRIKRLILSLGLGVENAIRPECLGKKNWLFAYTPSGASASAFFYSLIETAKANGLEPYWYLRYLFTNIITAKTEEDFRKLLPQYVDRMDILEYRLPDKWV